MPFSFVYGGRHSSEFIHGWNRQTTEEQLGRATIRRTLTLTDPATQLEVRAVCMTYLDTAGVDWTLFFINRGQEDTPVIEHLWAVDAAATIDPGAKAVLHRLNGSPCTADDWLPFDQALAEGQRIDFNTFGGRSSNVSPWFNVDWGSGGLITAIGWSGQWHASVEHKAGGVRTQAGMEHLHTVLHPGESMRTPRILQLRWEGGDVCRAHNLFRQTMLAHIMPRIDGQLVVPPIVHLSTSFHELNDSNEQNVLSHLNSIRGLGFEMFWLDAYWTGPNGFPNSMGNYGFPIERVEPKDRFPNGLKAIGEAVEREGLGFVLWFEPERVAADTLIAKEHPEWVLTTAAGRGGLFNLGILEARRYMTDYLNDAIKAYKVSCLRIDFNIEPLPFWQLADASVPNRLGMSEIRYIEGLYQMWDDILKANPGLFIDNCASGGRRIDVETMSRSIPLWRSDNTCDMLDKKASTISLAAFKNQIMSDGLNRYVPFSTCGQMGADPYHFRSGFNAGISFGDDVRPETYPRELLRQAIAEGKRIRKYFFGNYYPLVESGASWQGWCVLQYHRPDAGDGMVLAFRRDQSPFTQVQAALRDVDPAVEYDVFVHLGYDVHDRITLKGEDLRRLAISIEDQPGSALIEYAPRQPE